MLTNICVIIGLAASVLAMLNAGRLKAICRLTALLFVTLLLLPLQLALYSLRLPLRGKVPRLWHRIVCRLVGLEIKKIGTPHKSPPTLFVSNHSSYLDINVLGALLKCSFIAKQEISGWPIFGFLARMQNTVFIERKAQHAEAQRDLVASLLEERRNLVLFPEGTCNNGQKILPFKSSLFGITEAYAADAPVMIQPITISYTRLNGIPIGRSLRPMLTWFGDMELLSHAWQLLHLGRVTVLVQFHPPLALHDYASRKQLGAACEQIVANGLIASYQKRLV
ncbi:MAG: 1-acyl-sn-glycerol-3-phosphate acyltransferase [Thalassospira sp.]|nr:1-acyl-sn-glycerol-3-phosphate acyltransferase [Thalassospira sp.]